MKERKLYVIKTKRGYLSTRRFNHRDSSYRMDNMDFDQARVFTRKQDAETACENRGEEVEEIYAYDYRW